MKKLTTVLLSFMFTMTFAVLLSAEGIEKGSAMDMDKGPMLEKGPLSKESKKVQASEGKQVEDLVEAVVEEPVEDGEMKKSDSSEWEVAHSAKANIKGTSQGSTISGNVDLVETGGGIQVVAALSGVTPPGKHGIHIHEKGSCDDGGKGAGGHFNPAGTDHGLLPRDGSGKAHAGDLGNIEIDENGNGSLVIFLPKVSLSDGHTNVAGKAIILHAKEDDFGQPTGNAGGRIGCGLIALNN